MEDYEVRDVGRRSETPDLKIELQLLVHPGVPFFPLIARIINLAEEPAHHALIRIYVEASLKLVHTPRGDTPHHFLQQPNEVRSVRSIDKQMHSFLYKWSAPPQLPLWSSELHLVGGDPDIHIGRTNSDYQHSIFWHVSAPKMGVKVGLYGLTIRAEGPDFVEL
jgi:hypothetical protein